MRWLNVWQLGQIESFRPATGWLPVLPKMLSQSSDPTLLLSFFLSEPKLKYQFVYLQIKKISKLIMWKILEKVKRVRIEFSSKKSYYRFEKLLNSKLIYIQTNSCHYFVILNCSVECSNLTHHGISKLKIGRTLHLFFQYSTDDTKNNLAVSVYGTKIVLFLICKKIHLFIWWY